MIRRLTSAPKPSLAGLLVERRAGRRRRRAVAVADAVEAGEVGARLGGGDHVVGGDARGRSAAAPTSSTLPPSSSIRAERLLEDRAHAGLDALAGQLRRNAEAQAVEALRRPAGAISLREAGRGRVARVVGRPCGAAAAPRR